MFVVLKEGKLWGFGCEEGKDPVVGISVCPVTVPEPTRLGCQSPCQVGGWSCAELAPTARLQVQQTVAPPRVLHSVPKSLLPAALEGWLHDPLGYYM